MKEKQYNKTYKVKLAYEQLTIASLIYFLLPLQKKVANPPAAGKSRAD